MKAYQYHRDASDTHIILLPPPPSYRSTKCTCMLLRNIAAVMFQMRDHCHFRFCEPSLRHRFYAVMMVKATPNCFTRYQLPMETNEEQ